MTADRNFTSRRFITVTMPEPVVRDLDARAALEGRPRSQVLAAAARAYLAIPYEPPPPPEDAWMDPLRAVGAKGTQAANCLLREGIRTREELDNTSNEQLLAIRNFGNAQLLLLYRLGWRTQPPQP